MPVNAYLARRFAGTECQSSVSAMPTASCWIWAEAQVLIRQEEPVPNDRSMTVIMSTASLEHAVYPLDEALAGGCPGWTLTWCPKARA